MANPVINRNKSKKIGVKMSKVKVKTNNKEDQALEVILAVTVAKLTVTSLYSVNIVTDISLFSYCYIITNSIQSGRTKYKITSIASKLWHISKLKIKSELYDCLIIVRYFNAEHTASSGHNKNS